MLLEFSVKNYKSIKDELTLSMMASKDTEHIEETMAFNTSRILRVSSIYGANGSGKSNLLTSLALMSYIVKQSISFQLGDRLNYNPHKLLLNKPTEFNVQFVKDNIRYAYGFSYDAKEIIDEYLYFYPVGGRQNKVFERSRENGLDINGKYGKQFEVSKSILTENRLFLSCCANYSQVKETQYCYLFFKYDIVTYNGLQISNWMDYSVEVLQNDPKIKKNVLDILKGLGSDIVSCEAKKITREITDDAKLGIPSAVIDYIKSQGPITEPNIEIQYEQFRLNLDEESNGIKRLFEILCPLIDILEKGRILIVDEIETSLHETIVYQLIKMFVKNKKSKAQIIFTTHDTNLLDLSLLRRDQIWFTELEPKLRVTELYSLSDIKNVRKDENIGKGYMQGKYGAVPMLNTSFLFD